MNPSACKSSIVLYALNQTQFNVGRMMCHNVTRAHCCEYITLCDIYSSYDQIVPSIVARLDSSCQWIYGCTICGNSSDVADISYIYLPAPGYVTYEYDWYPSFTETMNYTSYTLGISNITLSKLRTSYYIRKCNGK